MRVIW